MGEMGLFCSRRKDGKQLESEKEEIDENYLDQSEDNPLAQKLLEGGCIPEEFILQMTDAFEYFDRVSIHL